MDEFEDDLILAKTPDLIERQLAYQKQIGGGATPLLDFQLCPVGARVNWRDALNNSSLRHASNDTGMPHLAMTWDVNHGCPSPHHYAAT